MKSNMRGMTTSVLRALATLFVFLLHGRSFVPKSTILPYPLDWISFFPAWAGVWIFLFLSGYGIGCGFFSGKYNLLGQNEKLKIGNFVKFYCGRFMKLAPPYYFFCFVYEILSGNPLFWTDIRTMFRIITFTYNGRGGGEAFGHLWYVSMAMQLYLFMPFLFLLIDRFKKSKTILLLFYGIAIIGGGYS